MTKEEFENIKLDDVIVCIKSEIRSNFDQRGWCPIGTRFKKSNGIGRFQALDNFKMYSKDPISAGSIFNFSNDPNELICYEIEKNISKINNSNFNRFSHLEE